MRASDSKPSVFLEPYDRTRLTPYLSRFWEHQSELGSQAPHPVVADGHVIHGDARMRVVRTAWRVPTASSPLRVPWTSDSAPRTSRSYGSRNHRVDALSKD